MTDRNLKQTVSLLISMSSVEGGSAQDYIDPLLLLSGSKVICNRQLMLHSSAGGKGHELQEVISQSEFLVFSYHCLLITRRKG